MSRDLSEYLSDYEAFLLPIEHQAHAVSLMAAADLSDFSKVTLTIREIEPSKIVFEYSHGFADVVSWFENEKHTWDLDHGSQDDEENRWELLEADYPRLLEDLPLVVLEGSDGRLYLNDGHHRLAVALKHQIPKVLVVVIS